MSFQGKQLAQFVSSSKIQACKHKLELGKFVSISVSFMAFQYLNVSNEINKTDLILYSEMCHYSEKICITANAYCYKIMHR